MGGLLAAVVMLTGNVAQASDDELRTELNALVLSPVNDGFGARDTAFGTSVGLADDISIVRVRSSAGAMFSYGARGRYMLGLGIDVGAIVLPIRGPVSPFVGGGVGMHYLRIRSELDVDRTGAVLTTAVRKQHTNTSVGISAFGRAGVLLFRGRRTEVMLAADYLVLEVESERRRGLLVSIGVTL